MSNFLCEFTEKTVKKYIGSNQWQDCTLSDNYMYLEYHDEGGHDSPCAEPDIRRRKKESKGTQRQPGESYGVRSEKIERLIFNTQWIQKL